MKNLCPQAELLLGFLYLCPYTTHLGSTLQGLTGAPWPSPGDQLPGLALTLLSLSASTFHVQPAHWVLSLSSSTRRWEQIAGGNAPFLLLLMSRVSGSWFHSTLPVSASPAGTTPLDEETKPKSFHCPPSKWWSWTRHLALLIPFSSLTTEGPGKAPGDHFLWWWPWTRPTATCTVLSLPQSTVLWRF